MANKAADRGATIPSNYSRLIARELGLQIKELPQLLLGTDFTVADFLHEETLLTADEQIGIWQNALRITDDETFGLNLGGRLTPSTHGAIGFLAYSSANFYTALQAIQAYVPTRMSFVRVELAEQHDRLVCDIFFDISLSQELKRSLAETMATLFLESAKTIIGQAPSEVEIAFPHPAPRYAGRYADYLPGKLSFAAPRLSISLPLAVCYEPNSSANHQGFSLALEQCEAMLTQLRCDQQSYRYRVQKMLLSHPPGTLSEAEAAASLFMSSRTLARKLKAEGSGFRLLREEILSQQAARYLRDSQLSVEAIAALLNYYDAANFRRAFKRWFSLPPEQYRRHNIVDTISPKQYRQQNSGNASAVTSGPQPQHLRRS